MMSKNKVFSLLVSSKVDLKAQRQVDQEEVRLA